MISALTYRCLRLALEVVVFVALTLAAVALLSVAQAQKPTQVAAAQVAQPVWRDYRGVQLGMTAAQVAQKLGAARETGDRMEFYVFSDSESAQVFYNTQHVVTAVSVSYLGEQSNAPTPEKIFGVPAEAKPDGSIYKMVKYPQAVTSSCTAVRRATRRSSWSPCRSSSSSWRST